VTKRCRNFHGTTYMVCSNVGICYIATMVNEWKWHYSNGGIITDGGKPKYSKKSMPPCRYAHLKTHMDCHTREQGSPMWQAGNKRPEWRHEPFEVDFKLQVKYTLDPRHTTWRVALRGRPAAQLLGSLRRHWNIVNMGVLTRGFDTQKNSS